MVLMTMTPPDYVTPCQQLWQETHQGIHPARVTLRHGFRSSRARSWILDSRCKLRLPGAGPAVGKPLVARIRFAVACLLYAEAEGKACVPRIRILMASNAMCVCVFRIKQSGLNKKNPVPDALY